MSTLFLYRLLVRPSHCCRVVSRRGILSSSYSCEDKWAERTSQPILSKIRPDALFTEISQRYLKKLKVGAVDIDIFSNSVTKEDQLDELEHLLVKLRKTRRTKDTLDSTHHAVCRAYLSFGAEKRLMKVIEDRVGFGIFPDCVTYNLLLDRFIERNDYLHAARVATLVMLQEEFSNPITNRLCLYAVYKYLNEPSELNWDGTSKVAAEEGADSAASEEAAEDEDDEDNTTYVRVPYLRNPYFDDHFDITDPTQLCGKTLHCFGMLFNDIAGSSCWLLGLALHGKWELAGQVLARIIAVKEVPEENDLKQAAQRFLSELEGFASRASTESLEELLRKKVDQIPALEEQDKTALVNNFKTWEVEREAALQKQLDVLLRDERMKEIEAKRKELEEREKLLFFFENERKHEMDLAVAEVRTKEVQRHSHVEEEYIPPKVRN